MISFLILLLSITILVVQLVFDKRTTALSPHVLFQVYFIIQLPLNLFLGTNYYLPRFDALSPLTSTIDIIRLGFFIVAAQIVFVMTIYILESKPGRRFKTARQIKVVAWPRLRVNILCAGIFAFGYVAFYALIYINGGFAAFAEARELWRTAGVGGQGWILFPATTMPAIAMCAVMIANRDQFTGRSGILKLLILYVVTALPASQLGFRSLIFFPLLQIGYFYYVFIRKIPGRQILLGSLVLIIAFTLYGTQREIPYRSSYGSYLEYLYYVYIVRPDLTYTVLLRSMGADIVQRTIDHVQTFRDYVYFLPALAEGLTIAIPSSLWADKPIPLLVQFSRNIFGIDGGVSPTVVGEGYWHAGLPGVIILMVVVGLLHAYFRALQRRAELNPESALLMLSIYPALIMMAESFQGYFNGLILILIANWLFRRLINGKSALIESDGLPASTANV